LDLIKYLKAKTYTQNLIQRVTAFLIWWLNKGEFVPLNTVATENAFSRVYSPIKKVRRHSSEKDLLNWLQIAFYQIFNPEFWALLCLNLTKLTQNDNKSKQC